MADTTIDTYLNLARLKASFAGKQSLLRSLIDEYSRQVERLLPQMRQSFDQGDWENLEHTAHTLKGNSSLLCAVKVQDLAKRIESSSRSLDSDAIEECLREINEAAQRTLFHLDALLNE